MNRIIKRRKLLQLRDDEPYPGTEIKPEIIETTIEPPVELEEIESQPTIEDLEWEIELLTKESKKIKKTGKKI